MLTFLRKIRRSLVPNEKNGQFGSSSGKYLLYALGEIALVVIGILIALQINNWNQARQDKNLEIEYLTRLRNDIVKDTSYFQDQIRSNLELRERIKRSLVLMYEGFENREQVVEFMTVYDEGLNQVFVSNSNTYTDLLSTGNLRLIRNIDLRDKIVNLYNQYEEKRKLMQSDKNWMDGIAVNLDSRVDFIKFSKDIIDIFTLPEMITDKEWSFLNDSNSEDFQFIVRAISSTAWNLSVSNDYYLELIKDCRLTLGAIQREL